MKKWIGAAGVCLNANRQLLMVKQGRPEEVKKWSIPSGGLEIGETIEQCCVRELREETGYDVEITEKAFVKNDIIDDYYVEVHYFLVNIIGGKQVIQDPDHLIYEIAWKSGRDINGLALSYPEDKDMMIRFTQ